jgi:hypothetical protein
MWPLAASMSWNQIRGFIYELDPSPRPRKYWSDLKRQLSEDEGFSELSDKIGQLAMPAEDGKSLHLLLIDHSEKVMKGPA